MQNISELELFVTEVCAEMLREGMCYTLMQTLQNYNVHVFMKTEIKLYLPFSRYGETDTTN